MRTDRVLALALLLGCTRTDNLAWSRERAAGDAGAVDADAEADADAGQIWTLDDAGVVHCGDRPCACSNGRDDDQDGLTDGFDPECAAAFDDHEESFATGVHGEDQDPKCQDCFFDKNSGRDEGCSRPRECALEGRAGNSGACQSCEVSSSCASACEPLVPNGCDCFGCCGVWRRGEQIFILLRPSCSLALLDDADACPRCIPAADCQNPCGECELCPGRSAADLPDACRQSGNGGDYGCDEGVRCTQGSCPSGQYCQQGCCMEIAF